MNPAFRYQKLSLHRVPLGQEEGGKQTVNKNHHQRSHKILNRLFLHPLKEVGDQIQVSLETIQARSTAAVPQMIPLTFLIAKVPEYHRKHSALTTVVLEQDLLPKKVTCLEALLERMITGVQANGRRLDRMLP